MSEFGNGGGKSVGERDFRYLNDVNTIGNRINQFLIDSGGVKELGWFHATKRYLYQEKITAVTIRENVSDKFSKVFRSLFDVPQELGNYFNDWTTVPLSNVYTDYIFYKGMRKAITVEKTILILNFIIEKTFVAL